MLQIGILSNDVIKGILFIFSHIFYQAHTLMYTLNIAITQNKDTQVVFFYNCLKTTIKRW